MTDEQTKAKLKLLKHGNELNKAIQYLMKLANKADREAEDAEARACIFRLKAEELHEKLKNLLPEMEAAGVKVVIQEEPDSSPAPAPPAEA